ncbi:MAG: TetR/AcrR family transcriptional regulator [Spirochaetota bacterium]
MNRKRALSSDEKELKRELIIRSAMDLFKHRDFLQIRMIDIAREAGVAKGTVFCYFKTKEELFLECTRREFVRFFNVLNGSLGLIIEQSKTLDINGCINLCDTALDAAPFLVRLSSILNTILEQNIDYDSARNFKMFLHDSIRNSAPLLERAMPSVSGNGTFVFLGIHTILVGLYQMTSPSPVVCQVYLNESMPLFQLDFRESFRAMLRTMLAGIAVTDGTVTDGSVMGNPGTYPGSFGDA